MSTIIKSYTSIILIIIAALLLGGIISATVDVRNARDFHAALHPEIVKGLIAVFNNQNINKNGSQLIFTTHNPIYLNNKIFRRDQILFVEKDKSTYRSAIYSLAEFGSKEVRNDENFLINYFKGKYTSMPYINFANFLQLSQHL